jgi:hypothetical protein
MKKELFIIPYAQTGTNLSTTTGKVSPAVFNARYSEVLLNMIQLVYRCKQQHDIKNNINGLSW